MRMQQRWYALLALYGLGGVALGSVFGRAGFIYVVLWWLVCVAAVLVLIRCPHCGHRPRPKGKLFMGKNCAACGGEY